MRPGLPEVLHLSGHFRYTRRREWEREKKRAGSYGVQAFLVLTLAQMGQGKITYFVDARPSHSA